MAQHRDPPAYQEYAASTLANRNFRLMTLAERGLFHTLRLECWQNSQVPATINELAKYFGFDAGDIKGALSEKVKSFFSEENGLFTCPELEDYRQHLKEIRANQSKGGKKGAAITNAKINKPRKPTNISNVGKSSSNSQVPRQLGVRSLVKLSSVKQSQAQSLESNINDGWVNDYDQAEHSVDNEYSRMKG